LPPSQLQQSTAPKHIIKTDQLLSFHSTLGHRFLAGRLQRQTLQLRLQANLSHRTKIVQRLADG
jgi:hypothetical protein